MINPFPQLMVLLTKKDRYLPDIEFKKEAWVYNCFRLYEKIFWRRYGIRFEQSVSTDETGRVTRFFGTWEAVFHQLEQSIRKGLELKWVPFKIYIPQMASAQGLNFSSPYLFAIGFDIGNAANSAGDTGTATFNLAASGANNKAIMFPQWEVASSFGSLTINSSSTGVTQYGSELSDAATNQEVRCYYKDDPPTSSVAYTITAGVFSARITAAIYSGAATGTLDSSASGTAAAATITMTTTVVASNCWLTGLGTGLGSNNLTAGSGTTLRNSSQTTFYYSADSNGTVGTGSQSLIWDKTSSLAMAAFVVSFAPTVATPANLKTYNTNVAANIKTINTNAKANVKTLDTNV